MHTLYQWLLWDTTRCRHSPAHAPADGGAWHVEQGGFLSEMTKREAAQILGTREGAREDKIREAHLRIMKANHPDLGGSSYLAEKVNEAKDMLLGKSKRRTSAF